MKFEFNLLLQAEIIRFILKDREGYKALALVRPEYFERIEHEVIILATVKFFKKMGRVPSHPLLIEEIKEVCKEPGIRNLLTDSMVTETFTELDSLCLRGPKDSDLILKKTAQFASFVQMRDTLSEVDLTDFESYKGFSEKISQALAISEVKTEDNSTLVLAQILERQAARRLAPSVVPTPFRQINKLTNAGGYNRGSIIVILDQPKNLKTAMLLNWARGYLRQKKKVFYVDLENGAEDITIRLEQSLSGKTKMEVLSGEHDRDIQKITRRYKRLGGEVYVKRFPAMSTTADIEREMDEMYRKEGIQFDILLFDYIGLMGSLSRKLDDKDRISDAYLDVANLALKKGIEQVVSTHHVIREAEKRKATAYIDNDIAKCIDIVRHVHAIYGLNHNEAEAEAGIIRMEIVSQRDGVPHGRALFLGDIPTQKIVEMTAAQQHEYHRIYQERLEHQKEGKGHGDI
jgi:hypothetical protein